MLEFFVNFFSQPFNWVMMLIGACIGIIIGLIFRPTFGNRVLKLIPRDNRFIEFNVDEETAHSIECKPKKGYPPQRFLKYHPGFTGRVGRFLKRASTIFLGKEGTAYTWKTKSSKIQVSLADTLKTLWGKEFYEQVPEEQRSKVESGKIDVAIGLEDGFTPEDLKKLTEEDIKTEEDRKAAETWWEGKKMTEKRQWIDMIIIALAGFGIAVTLQVLGILRI